MAEGTDWQCSECGTLIDGPDTRKCPNCGGTNFYPLADEIPGTEHGDVETVIDVEDELERLSNDEDA